MKNLITLLLLLITTFGYCQDTIKTVSNETIIVNVIEVKNNEIIYRIYGYNDGRIFSIYKDNIKRVCYLNGNIEIYVEDISIMDGVEYTDSELFDKLTAKNKTVFIYSENTNAIIHATNTISAWGYWAITTNKADADFILKFNVRFGTLGDAYGNAQFINPKDDRIFKETPEMNTKMSMDFNTKRGLINKVIKKAIKPMVKNS